MYTYVDTKEKYYNSNDCKFIFLIKKNILEKNRWKVVNFKKSFTFSKAQCEEKTVLNTVCVYLRDDTAKLYTYYTYN